MPSLVTYSVTISNFSGKTPCNGYYVYTGLTHEIGSANYVNNIQTLIPITTGYTFYISLMDNIPQMFVFVEHCDGHINPVPTSVPKLQGGYQLALVDLRCDDCYHPCDFNLNVVQLP